MEYRIIKALKKPQPGAEIKSQGRRPQALDQKRPLQDEPGHTDDASYLGRCHRLPHKDAGGQADLLARKGMGGQKDRHKAQSPHLDQQEQDDLAEQGPVGIRIKAHQTRHTSRRDCRKKRVRHRRHDPLSGGDRQHQKDRSY